MPPWTVNGSWYEWKVATTGASAHSTPSSEVLGAKGSWTWITSGRKSSNAPRTTAAEKGSMQSGATEPLKRARRSASATRCWPTTSPQPARRKVAPASAPIEPAPICRLKMTTSESSAAMRVQNPATRASPPSIAPSGTARASAGAPGMMRSRSARRRSAADRPKRTFAKNVRTFVWLCPVVPARRRAVSLRWLGDDAVFALRPWLHHAVPPCLSCASRLCRCGRVRTRRGCR